jgi:tripartite-type tricarboxylate transporter receptor subunit TctC
MGILTRFGRRALLALALAAPVTANAETWPTRPIRFIATGPAGGAGDVITRIVMERVSRGLGQPIVVENRPGAGTNIGAAAVARAAPDGYTIGLASLASNAVNVSLYRSLPFDPAKDFEPVGLMATVPNMLVTPNSLPARSVAEFIALCRAAPRGFRYGSIGAGSSQHLAGAQFGLATGCTLEHIAYTGAGALNTDLINGRIEVSFVSISSAAELARAGQMRALAVSSPERVPAFPELPTIREAGVNLTSGGWFGVMAPAGTPAAVLDRLAREVSAALADPDTAARIVATGATPQDISRSAFATFMAEETATWREVVRRSGATVD